VIQQFRAVNPRVRPGSKVAFLDDPFHSWDMFVRRRTLVPRPHSRHHVERHGPLTPQELAQTDSIFTFENGKLVRLK